MLNDLIDQTKTIKWNYSTLWSTDIQDLSKLLSEASFSVAKHVVLSYSQGTMVEYMNGGLTNFFLIYKTLFPAQEINVTSDINQKVAAAANLLVKALEDDLERDELGEVLTLWYKIIRTIRPVDEGLNDTIFVIISAISLHLYNTIFIIDSWNQF